MVYLSKVFTLPSLLFLLHGVQSYCIYNYFTDGTLIEVRQKIYGVTVDQRFNKHISMGDKACCHYSNKDCSYSNVDSDNNAFEVYFKWPGSKSEKHVVECVSGGGLSFYGNEKDYYAQCSEPSGVVVRVPIRLAADRS